MGSSTEREDGARADVDATGTPPESAEPTTSTGADKAATPAPRPAAEASSAADVDAVARDDAEADETAGDDAEADDADDAAVDDAEVDDAEVDAVAVHDTEADEAAVDDAEVDETADDAEADDAEADETADDAEVDEPDETADDAEADDDSVDDVDAAADEAETADEAPAAADTRAVDEAVPAPGTAHRPVADVTETAVTEPVVDEVRPQPVRTPVLDAVAQAGRVDRSDPEPETTATEAGTAALAPASSEHPVAPTGAGDPAGVRGAPTATATDTDAAQQRPQVVGAAATAMAASAALATMHGAAPAGGPVPVVGPASAAPTAAVLPAPAAQTTAVLRAVEPAGAALPSEPRSPLDVFESDDRPRRWPRVLVTIVSIVVVLGGAYVGACYAFADKVARGATVAGVEIGGMGKDAAIAALGSGLADVTSKPIAVTAGTESGSVEPASAGLTFDATATVAKLTGVDLHPSRLWDLLFGVGAQPAVTHVDEKLLAAAVDTLGSSLAVAPVDGGIIFADSAPHATAAVDGAALDTTSAAATLRDSWLTGAQPLVLATTPVAPAITQAMTDRAMTEVATPVTSAPVTVQVGGQLVELPAAAIAAVASFVPADSGLVLQLDGPKLVEAVLARTTNLLTASADAHFEFQNDAPVVVPGTPGTTLDPAALATAVAAAAVAPVRTATVDLVPSDPAQSTQKLEALGITAKIVEFSTPLTSEPRRTANIANGASKVNGRVVEPGATFSLTEALGPITTENGYQMAGVLVEGEHQDGMGGGLSQMATTTYNAGFLAGYEDIEHRPHSEWFSRYPEGRESTIYTGVIDMRWKNNTPYGVLLQSWVADGRVYVRLWSTPYWTVESSTSARTDVVQPTTTYSQSPTCVNQAAGNPGFKVSVTRTVSLAGVVAETKTNSWRYKASNRIVCGTAPTG